MVAQLLVEIDALHETPSSSTSSSSNSTDTAGIRGVFFIGATNRPDLLDTGLLRRGRLDVKLYLPPCCDAAARHKVLQAQTKAFLMAEDVDLFQIAASLDNTLTGADISAISSTAYMHALDRKISEISNEALSQSSSDDYDESVEINLYLESLTDSRDTDIVVSQQDFIHACSNITPSLTQADLDHYSKLGRLYSNSKDVFL